MKRRKANFNQDVLEEDLVENEEEEEEEELVTDYNYDLFTRTVENIRNAVATGVLDSEEGEELELQAIADYKQRIAGDLGYEVEDEDEDAEYSDSSDIANFEAGNRFGAAIVHLLAEAGYEDLEEGVVDLAESLGLDAEETAGLLTGDFVPTQELVEHLANCFELEQEDYETLDELGEESRQEAGYDSEDPEETEQEARYSRVERDLANFQYQAAIKDELVELERDAVKGVDEGWLPPIVYRELLGSFELEKDRNAAFSDLCVELEVNPEVQLYAMHHTLEHFRRCGPMMTFSAIVDEPLNPREAEFEAATTDQAERNFQLRKERNGG